MKYCWLILVFAVSCCSAAANDGSDSDEELLKKHRAHAEERMKEMMITRINNLFENFTDFLQDRHPSVAGPIKNLTTCIEEGGLKEVLKDMVIGAEIHMIKHSNLTERQNFCTNNSDAIYEILNCVEMVGTPESAAFLSTLWNTAHFMLGEFCESPEPFKFFKIEPETIADLPEFHEPVMKFVHLIGNRTVPTKEEYCLPLRLAEGYEIAAIRTHAVPFHFHGQIAEAYHFLATIVGYFPFKTVAECA